MFFFVDKGAYAGTVTPATFQFYMLCADLGLPKQDEKYSFSYPASVFCTVGSGRWHHKTGKGHSRGKLRHISLHCFSRVHLMCMSQASTDWNTRPGWKPSSFLTSCCLKQGWWNYSAVPISWARSLLTIRTAKHRYEICLEDNSLQLPPVRRLKP